MIQLRCMINLLFEATPEWKRFWIDPSRILFRTNIFQTQDVWNLFLRRHRIVFHLFSNDNFRHSIQLSPSIIPVFKEPRESKFEDNLLPLTSGKNCEMFGTIRVVATTRVTEFNRSKFTIRRLA